MQQRGQMDGLIGRRLGAYELQSRIGAGGMGVVYRAVHHRLGQPRAIKVLPANFANDETFVERFEREAQLASELRHPNIVVIHDIAEDDGVTFIVMELIEGRTLREVIHQDGPLPPDRAIGLLAQLADALDFAHQRGVVHRDIKPGNALVSPTDHLTLVDFGIARAAEGTRLTEAGARIGTAEYMAPESITEGDSGPGTDLYALGIIAYETLTGRTPFTGVNSQAIMYAQIHTPPPSPRGYRADLSPSLERVMVRQLGKDPSQRYSTGQAFVEALDEAIQRARWVAESQGGSPLPGGAPAASRLPSRGPVGPVTGGAGTVSQDAATASGSTASRRRTGVDASSQARSGPDSGSVPIPVPPSPGTDPGARAPSTGTIDAPPEIPFGPATLLKLVFGVTMLILLLMTFLPMPRDPEATNYSERLEAPRGLAGRAMLGTDEQGRDVLSRMIAGGRFILIRALVIGALVTAAGLAIRRRAQRRGGRVWLTASRLIMTVAMVLAVSMLLELAIGLFGGVGSLSIRRLQVSGIVGRLFLGVPPSPSSTPSWGGMLANGTDLGMQAVWLIVFPGLALLMVVVGFPLLGSGIVDLLRLRRQSVERGRQTSDTAILS